MADKEYSDSFTIVKSHEGMVRVVSNKLSMKILDMLSSAPLSLTDMANRIELPKTTVQSNLSVLEFEGLVKSYPSMADGRSMMYDRTCDQLYETREIDWD